MKKKVLTIILCTVLTMAVTFCLAGCAGNSKEKYIGRWEITKIVTERGEYASLEDYTDLWDGNFSYELYEDGTAIHTDDYSSDGTWKTTADGVVIEMSWGKSKLVPEKDGQLRLAYTIEYADDTTEEVQIYFEKYPLETDSAAATD